MIRVHSIRWVHLVFIIGLLGFANPAGTVSAGMTDYCQVPPYVVQNIQPNVLILLDVSRSMQYFAYYDGYNTPDNTVDDNYCSNSALPCTQYNYTGRPLTYYGYFDPNQWYTYGSNVFTAVGSRTPTNPNHYWSGDFLNWLTMRRIDVMRKVLTGGKPTSNKLSVWKPDGEDLGIYKHITSAELSANTPFTHGGGGDFVLSFGSGNADFTVYTGGSAHGNSDKLNSQPYSVTVAVPLPVEGVLQQTVGARARVGLMLFDASNSGKIVSDVGKAQGSLSSLASTINQINNSPPTVGATPLAEALWAAVGSFAQQDRLGTISGYAAGPGPNYGSSYTANDTKDPMNFGTGGSGARYPVCQKNFVLLLTDGDPYQDGNLPAAITTYGGNSAFNCTGTICPAQSGTGYSFPYTDLIVPVPSYGTSGVTSGVEDVALLMHTNDLRNRPTIGVDNIAGFQNLTLYTVFAFGRGSSLLKYAAINGGFENSGPDQWPSTGSPSNWDKNGDGKPDTYYEATEGAELEQAVRDAFSGILKRASSGTAASVLASGEGSGANLIQAVFYPRRAVGNDIVWWTGSLQNMWYFVDPFFANATIREDTDNNAVLHLVNDRIVQFFFDPVSQLTQVKRWYSDNNGLQTTQDTTLSFENIHSLWEAGKKLWERDLTSIPRKIYTNNIGGALDPSSTMTVFSTGNSAQLIPYLLEPADNAVQTINYVHGIDNTDDLTMRSRTVTFVSDNNVWKLGDVVNSTPRIVASVPLNKYDTVYNDTTYKLFTDNTNYKNRGMVFTGGNDGMLHAFRLGKLELSWTGKAQVEKARITNPENPGDLTPLGDEAWAFIPKNALPYLKYLKDPDYCHLYYTDLAPYVFDASIGGADTATRSVSSWRTVLIGGMRTGGACADTCSTSDCVKTPGTGKGFSSYFALDVTDPMNPSLMWEFTTPGLGFTTTGPAIVRVNAVNTSTSFRDRTLNGEWYVVFGSGPTGPIDNTNNQFLGRSNQPLKFFVLNLKTGTLKQTIDTGIPDAFAGSMINSVADFSLLDYQDDAIYVGYVKKVGSGSSATWTDGGVGRILTANTTPIDASGGSWKWSKVIDGTTTYPIGPVTSAVARLQNTNLGTNWLFFGAGRYFFENPPTGTNTTPEIDDATGQRRLFGIKDPCFVNGTMSDPTSCASVAQVSFPTLGNATVNTSPLTEDSQGWYITLEGSSTIGTTSTYFTYDNVTRPYRAERVITDPLATTSGVVFFTTYKPYADECALGGKSFLWALRYNTGDAPSYAVMKGKALVQVSTASIEQIDLSKAFKAEYGGGMGGRRTGAIEGVPPTAQGLSLLSQPPPVKRIMHMMER